MVKRFYGVRRYAKSLMYRFEDARITIPRLCYSWPLQGQPEKALLRRSALGYGLGLAAVFCVALLVVF